MVRTFSCTYWLSVFLWGELSIQILDSFFNWVVFLLLSWKEVLTYSKYKSLIRYMICKYFFPMLWLCYEPFPPNTLVFQQTSIERLPSAGHRPQQAEVRAVSELRTQVRTGADHSLIIKQNGVSTEGTESVGGRVHVWRTIPDESLGAFIQAAICERGL